MMRWTVLMTMMARTATCSIVQCASGTLHASSQRAQIIAWQEQCMRPRNERRSSPGGMAATGANRHAECRVHATRQCVAVTGEGAVGTRRCNGPRGYAGAARGTRRAAPTRVLCLQPAGAWLNCESRWCPWCPAAGSRQPCR